MAARSIFSVSSFPMLPAMAFSTIQAHGVQISDQRARCFKLARPYARVAIPEGLHSRWAGRVQTVLRSCPNSMKSTQLLVTEDLMTSHLLGLLKTWKDDEIDVIAWKLEPDGRPGSIYFLGQAASGADWNSKSLKSAIDPFHSTWFVQPPASHPTPGIIMPFLLSSPSDADTEDPPRPRQDRRGILAHCQRNGSRSLSASRCALC